MSVMQIEAVEKDSLLESSSVTVDLQSKSPSPRSRPGSPRWAVIRLLKRISLLQKAAEKYPQPDIKLVWPENFEPPLLLTDSDAALWQEVLVKFGACEAPATVTAQHLNKIIQAGMDANAVPFPCMPPRQGVSKKLTVELPGRASNVSVLQQDALAFPLLWV